jgi:hypothetical protein
MLILPAFYRLYYSILGAPCHDPEAISGDSDCLVVAGVDGKPQEAFLLRNLGGDDLTQCRFRDHSRDMGHGDGAPGGMIDRHGGEILNQGSSAPDIQRLGSETDGQEGLIEVMGILDQEFVNVLTRWIGGIALRNRILAVLLWVYIRRRAGKQNPMAGVDEVYCLARCGIERDLHGISTGAANRLCILGPGASVVLRISAGRDRYSDARLHTSIMIRLLGSPESTGSPSR